MGDSKIRTRPHVPAQRSRPPTRRRPHGHHRHQVPRIVDATPGAAGALWAGLSIHLAVEGIVSGDEPGVVLMDDDARPTAGLVMGLDGHRIYLAGRASHEPFNQDAAQRLRERSQDGRQDLVLYHDGGEWANPDAIASLLPDAKVTRLERRYLRLDSSTARHDWRSTIPPGVRVRSITADLLHEGLRHTDDLTEEMCSESPSVEAFLAKKFGVCIQVDDTIASFCCSEYNRPTRCELGITTLPPSRRRGFAALAVNATVEEALHRGITHIGWHAWATNTASINLALKAGFQPAADYQVWLCSWKTA